MSGRRQSGVALPVTLLLVCIGLVLVVYQEMAANSRPRAVRAVDGGSSTAVAALPAAVEFTMTPLGDFEATVERPLFSASRRPPDAAPVAAAVVVVEPLELELRGVIGVANGQIAILADTTSGSTVTLGQGKQYRGWTLAEIHPDRVVFRRADQVQRFTLNYRVAPKIKPPTGKRKRKRSSNRKRPPRQTELDRSKPTRTDDD